MGANRNERMDSQPSRGSRQQRNGGSQYATDERARNIDADVMSKLVQ
jgi:hypothetical protein